MEQKISLNTDYGLWARDGNTFIHVRRVENKGHLVGINLYIIDDQQVLQQTVSAATADYKNDHWELQRVNVVTIEPTELKKSYSDTMQWQSLLNPDVVSVVSVTPENLSVWRCELYRIPERKSARCQSL